MSLLALLAVAVGVVLIIAAARGSLPELWAAVKGNASSLVKRVGG